MACRQCYAKHVGKNLEDVKASTEDWGVKAEDQSCNCSICDGSGYIVPQGSTAARPFGDVSYPPCKHCNATGFCKNNPW